MTTYKLTYFDCRGRGELIRLIFHAAGVNFFDERVKKSPDDKQIDLPRFTILDHTEVSSSNAIARYLARQLNLAGSGDENDIEACQIDVVVDTATDLLRAQIDRIAQGKEIIDNDDQIKPHLDRLEKVITLYGKNGYSVGDDGLKWCDLAVYDATTYLVELLPNALDSYENIRRVRKTVEEHERVSGYLKYRPTTPFMIPAAL